jgi:hypothetical protein
VFRKVKGRPELWTPPFSQRLHGSEKDLLESGKIYEVE